MQAPVPMPGFLVVSRPERSETTVERSRRAVIVRASTTGLDTDFVLLDPPLSEK